MIEIPMTPEQYASAGQQLQAKQGVALTGNEGTLSKMGVTAAYKYDGAHLSINILEKPFFLSEDFCEAEIKKFVSAV